MDFSFSKKEHSFRKEVREFIQQETPQRWWDIKPAPLEESDEIVEVCREFERKLAKKRWLAPRYPEEYGGMAATQWQRVILAEELAYTRAPIGLEVEIAVDWIGPTILLFGTEEQKQKYAGGIARGELLFCLGYSEPNAGSDLASMQTSAVEQDDCYIINGQKIWTTYAEYADCVWLAAKTDLNAPKHNGMTLFIVDAKTQGITVRPIINMLNTKSFNEVFFDQVKIPKSSIVGQKNRGWHQLMAALTFERSGIALVVEAKRIIDDLITYVKKTIVQGHPLSQDPIVRSKIADLVVQERVARLLSYRVSSKQQKGKGHIATAEASTSAAFQFDFLRHVANIGLEILGLSGQVSKSIEWAPLNARILDFYLWTPAAGIGGGTREVQRNILATNVLGLPATKDR